MTPENKSFNHYRITWVELFPMTKSEVSKHDRKVFGDALLLGKDKTYRKHFPSKQSALDWISNFRQPLNDRYKRLLFTDKQFGMANESDNFAIKYTKKQLEEVYYIG